MIFDARSIAVVGASHDPAKVGLSADVPHLQELEINPLLVGPESTIAVDVRGTIS
jgi:hypothetical protein